MRSIGKDIQFSLRAFRKAPVFTAVALLSLALGIGANTAIFTLLDQVLLRLMPVKNPQELVLLANKGINYGSNWGDHAMSYPMYRDFKANNAVFSDMFCRFGNQLKPGIQRLNREGRWRVRFGQHISPCWAWARRLGARLRPMTIASRTAVRW